MHSNGSMMYIMCMCAIALLLAPVSRTKCCQMTGMRVVPAFKELHLSYMQLSEASSHAPDSTKGPTLESCLLHKSVCRTCSSNHRMYSKHCNMLTPNPQWIKWACSSMTEAVVQKHVSYMTACNKLYNQITSLQMAPIKMMHMARSWGMLILQQQGTKFCLVKCCKDCKQLSKQGCHSMPQRMFRQTQQLWPG